MNFSWRNLCGPNPNPMTERECLGLQELCEELPEAPVIVQIGAERGTSTLAMLEARPDAFIYSIDQGECETEFRNLRAAGLNVSRVKRVLGKSQEVGISWDIKCHMLFVDGDHSYEGVKRDIELFVPWVHHKGIIAFHDYIPDPIPPEIKGRAAYAIDEFFNDNEAILWIERLIAFQNS